MTNIMDRVSDFLTYFSTSNSLKLTKKTIIVGNVPLMINSKIVPLYEVDKQLQTQLTMIKSRNAHEEKKMETMKNQLDTLETQLQEVFKFSNTRLQAMSMEFSTLYKTIDVFETQLKSLEDSVNSTAS